MIISTKDFGANQTKYLNMVSNGEEVIFSLQCTIKLTIKHRKAPSIQSCHSIL
jgi:hypothetical protein